MEELLNSPASILKTSSASGLLCAVQSLTATSCLLLGPVSLLLILDGVSMAEAKMSIKGARERLTVFRALAGFTLGEGPGAPPGALDETGTFPFLGLPSPAGLICLDVFFLSLTGLSCC